MSPFRSTRLRNAWIWLRARAEVLVPLLGLPLFLTMVTQMGVTLSGLQTAVACGSALVYAILVLWSPMSLPAKEPQPVTWARIGRATVIVLPLLIAALLAQNALFPSSSESGGGGLWMLLLLVTLGIGGVVAEGMLPLDLFPVLRRREARRLLYVVVAALFLTMLAQLWESIFGGLALQIGRALAETPPESADMVSYFAGYAPWELFLTHLISAGFEETLFRLGIMTLVWALTSRWWLGLLASALCFGLYHISPLSSIAVYNLQAPVTTVLQSFGAGLATGIIYRYRGFLAAVLIHALGNWLLLMLLAQTAP